jgi:pilus assembly protein TadC
VSPLLLWALALLCAAAGLRERRAAARPAAAAATGATVRRGVPGLLVVAARVPCPDALSRLAARDGDAARIVRAGMVGVVVPAAVARARVNGALAGVVAAAALAIVTPPAALLAPVFAGLGLMAPGYALTVAERARRRALVRELPDLLDLLGICVESGMALDPALDLASGRLGGVLGEEIGAVLRDLSLGTPRAAAYRDLTARVGAPELARTVGALLQAEELGAPLSRALEGQAGALRASRRQDARERAARAAPKIQLVVAMVMVPAVLLLVIGVLLIELARQVGGVVG